MELLSQCKDVCSLECDCVCGVLARISVHVCSNPTAYVISLRVCTIELYS